MKHRGSPPGAQALLDKEYMFQEQKHTTTTIPPDPRVVQYQSFRWIYWLNPVWMLLIAFTQFAVHGFNVVALPLWDILYCFFLVLVALLTVVALPYQGRWFQRLALRRQAAARGDVSLLADPQPLPDAFALPLPFSIDALPRASTRAMVALGIIFGVIIALMSATIGFLIATSRAGHSTALHVSILALVAIVIIAAFTAVLLVVLVRQNTFRQKITFTEHGIMQLGSSSQVHSISWRDVRLFIGDTPTGLVQINKQRLPLTFQIASANEVVQWNWVRRSIYSKPPLGNTREEYNQQMQRLLSLITARTGLPLYDLSKKSSAE
jgi:hypothetical protein